MADKLKVYSKYQPKTKFERKKCPHCRTMFPVSKGIHILSDNKNNIYCSLNCLPHKSIEFLNCSVCNKVVENESIFCEMCDSWVHQHCSRLTDEELKILHSDDNNWICFPCKKSIFPCIAQSTVQPIPKLDEVPFKPPYGSKIKSV